MGSTHKTGRSGGNRRAFRVETLETRQLLSGVDTLLNGTALAGPIPAGYPGGSTTGTDYQTITGAAAVRNTYGVDGTGSSVAVIDTGVNYNHEALGSGFGPGHKVIAGWDFAQNDGDPIATWQHGTAVAGLIASSDPAHLGIAPGADIVALRVFGNDNKGDFNRVADALQWVIDNHSKYNITVVNISLSDGNNYSLNWFANDGGVGGRITSLIQKLDQLNIPVVTATGNSFNGQQGQGFTSIVSDSISVTATDATDHVVGNAQRLGKSVGGAYATDLAAPGAGMVAPVDGNNFVGGDGTSFAAPIVTGGIVLLQQIYKARFGALPTVDQIDSWLQNGGTVVHDSVTGIDIGRADFNKAASLIPGAPTPVSRPAPVLDVPAPASSVPAPTPSPAPAPSVVTTPPPTTTTTDTSGDSSQSKPKSDVATQFATLLQTLFKAQAKSVQVWTAKTVAQAPASSNPFAKLGMSNVSVKSWTATNAVQPHPTGILAARHSAVSRRRHGR